MGDKKNNEQEIREIHLLEQNLRNLLLQKQAFQMELSETKAAKKETEKSNEVFKIIGQLMIKSDIKKVLEELSNKEKLLDLRIKSLEKQESELTNMLESLRKEILGS